MKGRYPSLFGDKRSLDLLQNDWGQFFRDMDLLPTKEGWTRLPAVDLVEHKDRVEVKADLPGMMPDEITVECLGDRLLIKAEHKEERREEPFEGDATREYHLLERVQDSVQRMVTLPFKVDRDDQVRAVYEQGVLSVTIPKSAHMKHRQRAIPVDHRG